MKKYESKLFLRIEPPATIYLCEFCREEDTYVGNLRFFFMIIST